jgi:predicted dehydrogenase
MATRAILCSPRPRAPRCSARNCAFRARSGGGTALADLPIPDKYRFVPEAVPQGSPYNVAQLYEKLADSIRTGKPASPDFSAAVTRHRLIDAIVRASDTGQKQLA